MPEVLEHNAFLTYCKICENGQEGGDLLHTWFCCLAHMAEHIAEFLHEQYGITPHVSIYASN
jgi:hypothetical protein